MSISLVSLSQHHSLSVQEISFREKLRIPDVTFPFFIFSLHFIFVKVTFSYFTIKILPPCNFSESPSLRVNWWYHTKDKVISPHSIVFLLLRHCWHCWNCWQHCWHHCWHSLPYFQMFLYLQHLAGSNLFNLKIYQRLIKICLFFPRLFVTQSRQKSCCKRPFMFEKQTTSSSSSSKASFSFPFTNEPSFCRKIKKGNQCPIKVSSL